MAESFSIRALIAAAMLFATTPGLASESVPDIAVSLAFVSVTVKPCIPPLPIGRAPGS